MERILVANSCLKLPISLHMELANEVHNGDSRIKFDSRIIVFSVIIFPRKHYYNPFKSANHSTEYQPSTNPLNNPTPSKWLAPTPLRGLQNVLPNVTHFIITCYTLLIEAPVFARFLLLRGRAGNRGSTLRTLTSNQLSRLTNPHIGISAAAAAIGCASGARAVYSGGGRPPTTLKKL